jgi:GTP-binding protein
VMDIRHPMKEFDHMMVNWCQTSHMPLHVLLTKSDKLKKGPAQSTLLTIRKELTEVLGDLVTLQTFSALKKQNVDQLRQRLDSWLLPEQDEQPEE